MSPRWTRRRSRACLVVDGTGSCGAVPDLPGRPPHHDSDLDGDDTTLHQLELSRSGGGHVEDATRVQGVEGTRSLIRSSTSRPLFRWRSRTRESNGKSSWLAVHAWLSNGSPLGPAGGRTQSAHAPRRPSASCDAPPRTGGPSVWHTRRRETRASAGMSRRHGLQPGRLAVGSSQAVRCAGSA